MKLPYTLFNLLFTLGLSLGYFGYIRPVQALISNTQKQQSVLQAKPKPHPAHLAFMSTEQLLTEINKASQNAQVLVQQIAPGKIALQNNALVYTYQLKLQGSYQALTKFINSLTPLPAIAVRHVVFNKTTQHTAEPILQAELNLRLYQPKQTSESTVVILGGSSQSLNPFANHSANESDVAWIQHCQMLGSGQSDGTTFSILQTPEGKLLTLKEGDAIRAGKVIAVKPSYTQISVLPAVITLVVNNYHD